MGVATDYARHHNSPRSFYLLCAGIPRLKVRNSVDLRDRSGFDSDTVIFENPTLAIHREENTILYEEINQTVNTIDCVDGLIE